MLQPQFLIGRYSVLGPLGAGGMAEVYLARPAGADATRLVALKCLRPAMAQDPENLIAFEDEARILSQLNDPRIVRFYESGNSGGTYFHALEYAPGASLAEVLDALRRQGRTVPLEAVAAIADDLLGALHAAHEARGRNGEALGVVHRDVSPQNLIVCSGGGCKLTDFGLAHFLTQVHLDAPDTVAGKPPYLAPEQLSRVHHDRRADIWSAALVLYELTTLHHPLAGVSDLETILRIRTEPIPSLSSFRGDIPGAFEGVLRLALSRDVAERFETAEVFREAIRFALPKTRGGRSVRRLLLSAFPERARKRRRMPLRMRALWAALLVAGLSLAAAAWLRLSSARTPNPITTRGHR